jgi:hypothetical protein
MALDFDDLWLTGPIFPEAFEEHRRCLHDFYAVAKTIIRTPAHVDKEFTIETVETPPEFFEFRRNIFSTLFQSVYRLLEIPEDRRRLYGSLNHLFRVWVTAADNLLDGEEKVVIPIRLPGHSRVMQQVISIMAADRILYRLLSEAASKGVITSDEGTLLSDQTLQVLLPSAAEEASEEGGIESRPEAEYVLFTIHLLKTGMLFQIPFLGPEQIEKGVESSRLRKSKKALEKFGLGCQLLDDIRDLAKDYLEKRHNYILSRIYGEGHRDYLTELVRLEPQIKPATKIHSLFPAEVHPTAIRAKQFLVEGLRELRELGLEMEEGRISRMANSMFFVLDVGDLAQ